MRKTYISPRAKVMTLSIGVVICDTGTFTKSKGNLNNNQPGYKGGSNGEAEAPGVGNWDDWEE